MNKIILTLSLLLIVMTLRAQNGITYQKPKISKGADQEFVVPVFKGEYLGQEKPGLTPKMFAPGSVSTKDRNVNATFHPNGREIYFTVEGPFRSHGTILVTKMVGDTWTTPEPMEVIGEYTSWEPFISKDGTKLFYVTNKPITESDSKNSQMDIWVLNREGNGWSDPHSSE